MNIFVTKLGFNVTSEDLDVLFSYYGDVDSAAVVVDRETGNSKGFGFVEMPNEDEAMDAIESLDDTEFKGKTIVVKVAEKKEKTKSFSRFSGSVLDDDFSEKPDRKIEKKTDRKKPSKRSFGYDD